MMGSVNSVSFFLCFAASSERCIFYDLLKGSFVPSLQDLQCGHIFNTLHDLLEYLEFRMRPLIII